MSENRVDATLTAADQQAVMTAIETIREKLPFLIDLTTEERRGLPKMGDKSRAFVYKSSYIFQVFMQARASLCESIYHGRSSRFPRLILAGFPTGLFKPVEEMRGI